jgi:hypothetical protein
MGSLIIVVMVLYVGDEHEILRFLVAALPRVSDQVDDLVVILTKTALSGTTAKRSLIRTTSGAHTGGELRCLSRSPPRAAAHIRELLLI